MLHIRNKTKNSRHIKVMRAGKNRWYAQMWLNTNGGYQLAVSVKRESMKEALEACIS